MFLAVPEKLNRFAPYLHLHPGTSPSCGSACSAVFVCMAARASMIRWRWGATSHMCNSIANKRESITVASLPNSRHRDCGNFCSASVKVGCSRSVCASAQARSLRKPR
jgi:hypothetical protein